MRIDDEPICLSNQNRKMSCKPKRPVLLRSTALAMAIAPLGVAPGIAAVPTFNQDIAPILYAKCVSCHRPEQIAAAYPLLTYDSAQRQARAIAEQVASRQMPPWPADSKDSLRLRNDPRLSTGDIEAVVRWANGGAPQGSGDPPLPPPEAPKWLFPGGRRPDAILKLSDVAIPARGEVPYVQQRVKVALPADQWIVAMQVLPGNREIVHHVGITEVAMSHDVSAQDLDALARVATRMGLPEDALISAQPAVLDTATSAYDMLGVYTPGSTFEMYDNGSAKLLKAGDNVYVNFNIHFTTNGVAQSNHLELALWFQPAAPEHQLIRAPAAVETVIANGTQILTDAPGTKAEGTDVAIPPIPPFATNFELIGMTAYREPLVIYQLQPHAHMRGASFRYSVVYPDGHELTVLSVPQYDFHWQLAYDLETPLHLPAGSKLVVTATYDNSAKNSHMREPGVDPSNCGPDKQAYFRRQNQSWNEMFTPLVQYAADRGPGAAKSRLVEALGCIARGDAQSWDLVRASEALDATSASTSASSLRASSTRPLGALRYRLIGAAAFRPQDHVRQKVEVKGLLIEDSADRRLNVTSLQKVAGSCH